MPRATRSFASATERGGALLVVVLCAAVLLGGLSVASYMRNRGALVDVDRTDALVHALELAEVGIARAELEIASQADAAGDGVGNLSGALAGGTYTVTATSSGNDWTIVSTGRTEKGVRRIEQGCRRVTGSGFAYAAFARSTLTITGNGTTDAYDSSLGTYASQATNVDGEGPYALSGGHIGTNAGNINLSGGIIRGDATPGPLYTLNDPTVVTGSTAPLSQPIAFPDTPQADFDAAYTTNSNGNWTAVGGSLTYVPATRKLTLSGGSGVLTLAPGTYFFSELVLSGGSKMVITGPTKIYVTNKSDTSGGGVMNTTHDPANLVIYGHPYPVPGVSSVTATTIKLTGGSDGYLCMYGPKINLTLSGGSPVWGSLMVGTMTASGGAAIHFDRNLLGGAGAPRVEETYWVERTPPLR